MVSPNSTHPTYARAIQSEDHCWFKGIFCTVIGLSSRDINKRKTGSYMEGTIRCTMLMRPYCALRLLHCDRYRSQLRDHSKFLKQKSTVQVRLCLQPKLRLCV